MSTVHRSTPCESLTSMQQWQVDRLSPEQRAEYDAIRAVGESHNWAFMFASKRFPQFQTDKSMARANGGKGEYYGALTENAATQDRIRSGKADPAAYCSTRREFVRKAADKGLSILDGPMGAKTIDVPSEKPGYKPYKCDERTAHALTTVAEDMVAGKEVPSVGEQRRQSAAIPLGDG